jgi:hypothetical protein
VLITKIWINVPDLAIEIGATALPKKPKILTGKLVKRLRKTQ